jgi:hypothetical protein
MNIYYIFRFISLFVVSNVFTLNIKTDIKRMVLLSKLIYDYDYLHKNNKKNFLLNINNNNNNITTEFIKKNNIYFNIKQFITSLNNKDFTKKTEKYFYLLNNFFPNIESYGYFNNDKKLHSFIILNKKNKEIIVVFRGSQYFNEWINNFKICEEKICFNNEHDYKIHNGIYNMYIDDNIDNNIIYILKELFHYYPDYRKIFTGHSRGSINSILLSFELSVKLEKKYNYEIFCYGTPPLFNKKFANFLNEQKHIKIYNIINELDIVTVLPFFGKYHVGKEILLKDKIIITDHKDIYKIKNNINLHNFYISIFNHDLDLYINKIFKF